MPGRQSRRSVIATIAALPLTGALSACSGSSRSSGSGRRKAPGRRPATFATDGAPQFAAFARQAGAQWYDTRAGAWNVSLADEPSRRVASYWQRLIDQDLVFMNAVDSRQYDAQVSNGQVLVRLSGARDAGAQMNARPGQKGKWAIAPLPQWKESDSALGTHGGSTPRGHLPQQAPGGRPGVHRVAGVPPPTRCAPGSPAAPAASIRPLRASSP